MAIFPKGARVLIEELPITNKEQTTKTGLIFSVNEKDYPDKILFKGKVLEVGTPEIDEQGIKREPDVKKGTVVYFNKRLASIVAFKDQKRYWIVKCSDVCAIDTEEKL